METIFILAFVVRYGALVALVAFMGALVVCTVNELVRDRMAESGVLGSAPVHEPVKGHAL
jgi:hypothetical protein